MADHAWISRQRLIGGMTKRSERRDLLSEREADSDWISCADCVAFTLSTIVRLVVSGDFDGVGRVRV